jgi:hypothetical protein
LGKKRRRLYEISELECFKARDLPARTMTEEKAVPLLVELVVRCGLATRELQR